MLLAPTRELGEAGKQIFHERMRKFLRGEWAELLAEAAANNALPKPTHGENVGDKRAQQAEAKVRMREVSRARRHLCSTGLAPGSAATLAELTSPTLRPPSLTEEIPADILSHSPSAPLKLDPNRLLDALRSAGRGSAQDLSGTRYEHYRVLLEDDDLWSLFAKFMQAFARGEVPPEVAQALRLGRMTALKKESGKVRGIVAGSIVRRLACRTVAHQCGDRFLAATAPFQYALQTRAGTEALAHTLRLFTELDEQLVVVSLDGIGAFDHVKRAAFMRKLHSRSELHEIIPLVSMLYGSVSRFVWYDDDGLEHIIEQGEGGEQGCPLMPALYALAQHDALAEAAAALEPGERIFSFLDDLYLVTSQERARAAFETVATSVEKHAGVQSHMGKLRMWSSAGVDALPEVAELRADVWTASKPAESNVLVILGTPLGTPEIVQAHAQQQIVKEKFLLGQIQGLPDLQCSWVLLSQCAVPRANHTIRILPPSLSGTYTKQHDDSIWKAFCESFSAKHLTEDELARQIASLPGRKGGLGLRSAERTATAAYWSSWANALGVMHTKTPDIAAEVVRQLAEADATVAPCLQELAQCKAELEEKGATDLPTWTEAAHGAQPPPPPEDGIDAADLDRGWQCHTSSFLENTFLEQVVLPSSDSSRHALLLSQSGGPASA